MNNLAKLIGKSSAALAISRHRRVGPFIAGFCLLLGLPCAFASRVPKIPAELGEPVRIATELPGECPINEGAGNGGGIKIKVKLESGDEVAMLLDTGGYGTILDKSLDPLLGKRLGSQTVHYGFYGWVGGSSYKAPKMTLNGVPLMTGKTVATHDVGKYLPPHSDIRGILGMDCLEHYCVQLDFVAGKVRFLDSEHLDTPNLGRAIPLSLAWFGNKVWVDGNLLGTEGARSIVDTGVSFDGALVEKEFRHALEKQWAVMPAGKQQTGPYKFRRAYMEKATFAGEDYRDVLVEESPDRDIIGLRFLARHLVTFDFPHHTLYLKRVKGGPVPSEAGPVEK